MGDYYQLNPIIKSFEADKKGMSISLFRKLSEKHPYKVMILRQSYIMNDAIANLSNSIAYKGLIRHATAELKDMKLDFDPLRDQPTEYPWLKELKNIERSVTLVNTENILNKIL